MFHDIPLLKDVFTLSHDKWVEKKASNDKISSLISGKNKRILHLINVMLLWNMFAVLFPRQCLFLEQSHNFNSLHMKLNFSFFCKKPTAKKGS